MRKNQSIRTFICIVFLIFTAGPSIASLKPVAEAVKKYHDLNIGFINYDLFYNAHETNDADINKVLSSSTSAELIPGKLSGLFSQSPSAITVNIPFHGSNIAIDLIKVNIFTGDFSVMTSENQTVSYTPGAYYRGTIKGNTNSIAAFSFFNNELYGVVSDDVNGNIVVGRLVQQGNNVNYIIYADKDLLKKPYFDCSTQPDPSQALRLQGLVPSQNTTSTLKCARLYYEVDYDSYVANGSNLTSTTNWITSIHNNISTIYSNDNINVGLSSVYIWTTTDPYTGATSTDQLHLFHSTRVSFNGDVGQLVAMDTGGNGGVAEQVNGLCTSFNYSYADIDLAFSTVPIFSWTIEAMTHEIGHLLGSEHTHNCSWPGGAIDDCGPNAGFPTEGGCPPGPTPANGGTIMSYCHLTAVGINFNNGFGPYPASAIQNAINNATCLGASCTVCPVPANNPCSSAQTLNISTNCIYTSGSLCGATEANPPITCGSRTAAHGYDIWYKVTPSQTDMVVKCQSGTSTDAVIALYSGTCAGLTLVNCSDGTTTGGLESISATVTAGNPYYIRVYDYNGNTSGTDFGICVSKSCASATNDSCIHSVPLTIGSSCSYTAGDLCSASQSMIPSTCSGYASNDAYDLWYAITPTQSNVRISCQPGPSTDIVLGIYSGNCNSLNLINCVDTMGAGGTEFIDANLTINNTYYIRVYDWNSNAYGTDFQICARYNSSCTTPAAPTSANANTSTICSGTLVTLNAAGTLTPGASWHWYTSSCGGTPAGTGASFLVSPSTSTTYYLRAEDGACYSTCKNVAITVNTTPSAPSTINALPAALCAGNSSVISLTGSLTTGANWTWYRDSCGGTSVGTGTSISVTPVVTTVYYVRGEKGGCYSNCLNVSLNVTSTPNPPISIIASSDTICSGTNATLNVNGSLSAGASWYWYSGSCAGTNVGAGVSKTVSPSSTTNYYVRAEKGQCYSACVSTIINVDPSPAAPLTASANPSSFCNGDSSTITLTGSLASGASWQWYADSCGGTTAGTGTTIVVHPSANSTYYVRAEKGNCSSNCVNAMLTVNQIPSPPQSTSPVTTSVCLGDSVDILVNGTLTAGSNWNWYTDSCGGTLAGQGSSLLIFPVVNKTYYVRAENANCRSACLSSTIDVYPTPTQPVINPSSNILSVQTFAAYQWYWSADSLTYVPSGNSQQITAGNDGYYYVIITDMNGCTSASDTFHYLDPNAVIENDLQNIISIYPNPVNNILSIELRSKTGDVSSTKIYDDMGRLIYSDELPVNKINYISFDRYSAGIYLLQISFAGKNYSQKIWKE